VFGSRIARAVGTRSAARAYLRASHQIICHFACVADRAASTSVDDIVFLRYVSVPREHKTLDDAFASAHKHGARASGRLLFLRRVRHINAYARVAVWWHLAWPSCIYWLLVGGGGTSTNVGATQRAYGVYLRSAVNVGDAAAGASWRGAQHRVTALVAHGVIARRQHGWFFRLIVFA